MFYSLPGEISEHGCWVLIHQSWLYAADTLFGLAWVAMAEWKLDRHLCG